MKCTDVETGLSDVGFDTFCNFLEASRKKSESHIPGNAGQDENVTFQADSVQSAEAHSHSKPPPWIVVPQGYRWDENQNILIPILEGISYDTACQSSEIRPRKLADYTWCTYQGLPFSGRGWNQEADFVKEAQQKAIESGEVRRVVTRMREFEDGYRLQLMAIENPEYVYVHKFRDDLYKVVVMLEAPNPDHGGTGREKSDDERWRTSLARARNAIEEIALCNEWQYFVTLTIDGEKLSRSDLEAFRKKLQQMIRNYRRNSGGNIEYLFVPELHPLGLQDGRTEWHLHGLMNISEDCLVPFENRKKYGKDGNRFPPRYIRDKVIAGKPVFYWRQYNSSFGGSVLEPVQNRDASARYLIKYVAKTQATTSEHLEKGQNLYYHSVGLKRAEKVPPDVWGDVKRLARGGFEKHYENCIVLWYEL